MTDYDRACAAVCHGVPPASIIKMLVAEGIPAPEVVQIMRQIVAVVSADAGSPRPTAPAIERRIAQRIHAGMDDASILRDLAACGVEIEAGRQLVRGVRGAWKTMQARQRRTALIRTAGIVGFVAVVLIGGLRLMAAIRTQPETSAAPTVVVAMNRSLQARITRVPNAVVIADSLNVRAGPGPEYPVLLQLHAHEPLRVIGRMEEPGRYLVQLPDERIAWVRSDPDMVRLDIPPEGLPRFVLEP